MAWLYQKRNSERSVSSNCCKNGELHSITAILNFTWNCFICLFTQRKHRYVDKLHYVILKQAPVAKTWNLQPNTLEVCVSTLSIKQN